MCVSGRGWRTRDLCGYSGRFRNLAFEIESPDSVTSDFTLEL